MGALEDYINKEITKGFSEQQIKDALVKAGYNDTAIKNGLANAEKERKLKEKEAAKQQEAQKKAEEQKRKELQRAEEKKQKESQKVEEQKRKEEEKAKQQEILEQRKREEQKQKAKEAEQKKEILLPTPLPAKEAAPKQSSYEATKRMPWLTPKMLLIYIIVIGLAVGTYMLLSVQLEQETATQGAGNIYTQQNTKLTGNLNSVEDICNAYEKQAAKDNCFYKYSRSRNNRELCYSISNETLKEGCLAAPLTMTDCWAQNRAGIDTDACYAEVAKNEEKKSYCNFIKDKEKKQACNAAFA